LSQTNEHERNSPAHMKFRFGRLNGTSDQHIYCAFQHHPDAHMLPDGTEFGWSYDIDGDSLSKDVIYSSLYQAVDIDMEEARCINEAVSEQIQILMKCRCLTEVCECLSGSYEVPW
jgi:hypothetical protein